MKKQAFIHLIKNSNLGYFIFFLATNTTTTTTTTYN